ncbi:hypothetical protein Q4I30_002669 [Leishmania utingensis]|uniref:Uncharacterized protein n=1 Tax=Leishmania utingensis TaxID=653362 RepID=A0AAW3ANR9_9TRYP
MAFGSLHYEPRQLHGGQRSTPRKKDPVPTRLPETMLALLRSSTCPHFGLLQRRATGSDGVARCPLLRWHCGAPPHLCLLWGHPTRNCARYATRDSRAARGPKHASSPAAA